MNLQKSFRLYFIFRKKLGGKLIFSLTKTMNRNLENYKSFSIIYYRFFWDLNNFFNTRARR